jgi:hypothetical protein
MPVSPQITITPEDITFKSFDITVVSYTSSTATYTATGHTLSAGDIVTITGLAPDGYNGTYTISSVATNTFTIANATNTALTDQAGNVYWADATEYEYSGGQTVTYRPNDGDVTSIIDTNATVANAAAQAASAASAAGTAQSTANTALANAATAYTAAVGSLQPSASTIVNSSNQITAIASNGITVYSGSSATSGARVVMNSAGLAGYDASNNATFSVTASTGAAVFKGSVTGATITGGTLNIAGNAIIDASGLLTCYSATINGTVNATAGYFGTSTNGFSISSTGLVGVGSGTISGGIISGTTFTNGSTFSVSSTGNLTASAGTIGGWKLSSSSLYTGTIGSETQYLSSSGGGLLTGAYTISSVATVTTLTVGSTATVTSTLRTNGNIEAGTMSSGSYTAVVWNSSNGRFYTSSSSERFKTNIKPVASVNYLSKLLQLEPVTFNYKAEFSDNPEKVSSGLIAERVAEIPEFETVVNFDKEGLPESIAYDRLSVFMIPALKDLNNRLLALEGK